MADWTPEKIEPIMPQGWDVVSHVPTLADAWDVNGQAIAQNMRDTMTAVRDPQTWTDAAREYGQALVAGTGVEGGGRILYHGTQKVLQGSGLRPSEYGHFGPAVYLSGQRDVAKGYGDKLWRTSVDGNLFQAYPRGGNNAGTLAQDPAALGKILDNLQPEQRAKVEAWQNWYRKDSEAFYQALSRNTSPEIAREAISKAGYAGIEGIGDGHEVAVFDPANVKLLGPDAPGGIQAFHGSPHSFDKFDIGKIGTGEGAQAYGRGLYFAGNEGVAQSYRDNLAPGRQLAVNGVPVSQLPEGHRGIALWMERTGRPPEDLIPITEQRIAKAREDGLSLGLDPEALIGEHQGILDAANALKGAQISRIPNGHMYEVNLNANPDHLLDWDKPFSEQDPKVQDALKSHGLEPKADAYVEPDDSAYAGLGFPPRPKLDPKVPDLTGKQIYHAAEGKIGDPAEAARVLHELGIPGIKYLDGSSRNAGEGSHNYVMFDDATIDLLRKYGLAGLMAGGGAAAMAQPAEAAPTPKQATPAPMDEWQPVSREPIAVEPISATVH